MENQLFINNKIAIDEKLTHYTVMNQVGNSKIPPSGHLFFLYQHKQ
jgi:hypothetical protein